MLTLSHCLVDFGVGSNGLLIHGPKGTRVLQNMVKVILNEQLEKYDVFQLSAHDQQRELISSPSLIVVYEKHLEHVHHIF